MASKTTKTNKALDEALAAQLPINGPKPARKKPAVKAAAKKVPAKKTAKAAPAKKTTKAEPEVSGPREGSKAAKATAIYLSGQAAGKTRAEILAAFIEHAGLTKAGANTYFANIKAKHG